MQFGIFDHFDASGQPLREFFADRLKLIEAYDRLGYYGFHSAEHHATPLGMAPSPSVIHAAIGERTKRIRFGPLVYTLNLYHPLRLSEEICMLDHLSGGRFLLGVGRGISPFELKYFGADPAAGQAMYVEAFEVLKKAFADDVLDHHGEYYQYTDVPIELHPYQKPHPPIWYGIGNPDSVEWCVANHVNVVANAPLELMKSITDRYHSAWRAAGHPATSIPKIGTSRHMVVADTDAEALAIARRGYAMWYASFAKLWRKHNAAPRFATYTEDFDDLVRKGQAIAGTPATVRKIIEDQLTDFDGNYMLCRFAFGNVTYAESLRSAELFAKEVMPAFVGQRPSAS